MPNLHLHLPKNFKDAAGALRTVARGNRSVRIAGADRMPKPRKARDMSKADFDELKGLLTKFFGEEEQEPEHAHDCTCGGK